MVFVQHWSLRFFLRSSHLLGRMRPVGPSMMGLPEPVIFGPPPNFKDNIKPKLVIKLFSLQTRSLKWGLLMHIIRPNHSLSYTHMRSHAREANG